MIQLRRAALTLSTATLILAGCGGGGGTSAAPSAGGATSEPSVATTSAAPAESQAAGSGGTGTGVCELATTDELATLLDLPSVTATVIPGPPDTCAIEDDAGIPMVAWTHLTSNATGTYDAFVLPDQSVEVSGLGDRAAFVDNTGLLVLKGDSLLTIGIMSGAGNRSEEDQQALQKEIAKLALGRM